MCRTIERCKCLALCIGVVCLLLGPGGCGGRNPYQLPGAPPPQQPPPTAQQSGAVTIAPQYATVAPGQLLRFAAQASGGGTLAWQVSQSPGGSSSVGSIDSHGNYTAPQVSLSTNVVVRVALAASPEQNFATAVVAVINTGQLTPTPNPQVVAYSIYLPAPGTVSVAFDENALLTSPQSTPSPYGGMVHVYVAGMLAQTVYHMRAMVKLTNGSFFDDSDHVFTTGAAPHTSTVQVSQKGSSPPQPGIELFDTVIPHNPAQLFATDLHGNVVWSYQYSGSSSDAVQGATLLPNGHFLVLISFLSSLPPAIIASLPSNTIDVIREIDLAGNTIRELTRDQLNQSLAAQGHNFDLQGFHHDVLPLPNGHMIVLADYRVVYNNLPGFPGSTSVLGDLLVDVDRNFTPTWMWSTFDHLDVNHHPMNFPDWTHGNAVLYSMDDHNLLFSMRHQNWIIKIDYADGQGSGKILWRLGPGGDFKLLGGVDPTDWFYAQHGPSFFSPNTTGVFQLGVMDNGDDRQFPPGVVCGSAGAPPCHYSTAPVLQIDEAAMTATLLSHYTPPASQYSYFGGNVDRLSNGDMEADFCAPTSGAIVQELTEGAQLVWQVTTPGADQFRAQRLSSLYPGVQW
jgi:arylsulfate sulfotransferase